MALKVFRVAVVGCPREIISQDRFYEGVGKSCLCNRFVRPEAYSEYHQQESLLTEDQWRRSPVHNGDHFIYWGAASKHLPDKTKVRFQVVEHTEFYRDVSKRVDTPSDGTSHSDQETSSTCSASESRLQLHSHPATEDYISRACSLHFKSRTPGKVAYRLQAQEAAVKRMSFGSVRSTTQLFPNEDFGGKKSMGIYGFVCIFDPTLEGDQMQRQLNFLSELLPMLAKKKRKIVIACVKCDAVEEIKIRFGSNLANYTLKKTIPFFEVSARERVNVDEVFFSLVNAPKKTKALKNTRRSSSGFFGYREVVESRKGDLNRAKDAYRRLLQQRVTNFSSTWSEVNQTLKKEHAYQMVTQLAGKDIEELLLKMFQLRLIEIKLMEASKLHGFHSTSKKLDHDQSKAYQVYLSEAFRAHPDLGNESVYEYVLSPRASVVGDADDLESVALTEPSTPSSYRNTPDLNLSESILTRPRSSTLPDVISAETSLGRMVASNSTQRLRSQQTIEEVPISPVSNGHLRNSLPREMSRNFNYVSPSHVAGNGQVVMVTGEKPNPPPLPSRDSLIISMGLEESLGTLKKDQTTISQPFLPDISPKHAELQQEGDAKRLSNSMDCLLLPDESDVVDRLDCEPYLQPLELKMVMSQLSPLGKSPKGSYSPNFMSMRVTNKSRPNLPPFRSFDNPDSPILKRTSSLTKRGHKRSRSNPWILENMSDAKPPKLPPRNTENVPPQGSKSGTAQAGESLVESSLEFGSSGPGIDTLRRGTNSKPLPPPPRQVNKSPQNIIRQLLEHTKADDNEPQDDDDNLSTISGPFEEIEPESQQIAERSGSQSDLSVKTSTTLPKDISSSNIHQEFLHGDATTTTVNDDDPSNQYAQIEDFQQYMEMASVSAIHDKSVTMPQMRTASTHEDGDSMTDAGSGGHGKRMQAKSVSHLPPGTPKKEMSSNSSAPLLATIKRKWKKTRNEPIIHEAATSPSPPPTVPLSAHSTASGGSSVLTSPYRHSANITRYSPMHTKEVRPLPPSPTKGLGHSGHRKVSSSGSNIYEVIDEELLSRIHNRPKRQSSAKEIINWAPPVDPTLWPKYFEVVQKFFSLPDVQDRWSETVRSVIPNEDPEDIHHPYYKVTTNLNLHEEAPTEEEIGETMQEESSDDDDDDDDEEVEDENKATGMSLISPKPKLPTDQDQIEISFRTPLEAGNSFGVSSGSSGGAVAVSPALRRVTKFTHTSSSPFQSPHLTRHNLSIERTPSRDDIINMINRQAASDSSDESDSDDDDASDSSELDSDVDMEPGHVSSLRQHLHRPKLVPVPQTDLDEAIGMRASISIDSDLLEVDSGVVKSSQSNSIEELEQDRMSSEEGSISVVHCIKPSQLVPKRSGSKRRGTGELRHLSDSGISQTYEDNSYTTNNQSESEC